MNTRDLIEFRFVCARMYANEAPELPHVAREYSNIRDDVGSCSVALRSGIIVADEVHPRRDYC